jgi:hypothetical protein
MQLLLLILVLDAATAKNVKFLMIYLIHSYRCLSEASINKLLDVEAKLEDELTLPKNKLGSSCYNWFI